MSSAKLFKHRKGGKVVEEIFPRKKQAEGKAEVKSNITEVKHLEVSPREVKEEKLKVEAPEVTLVIKTKKKKLQNSRKKLYQKSLISKVGK